VILFRSTTENEVKYFVVEPYLNPEERDILEFLKNKLQDTIKFSEEATRGDRTSAERAAHIEQETFSLLFKYDLITHTPFTDPDIQTPLDEPLTNPTPGHSHTSHESKTVESEPNSSGNSRLQSLLSFLNKTADRKSIVEELISTSTDSTNSSERPTPTTVYTQPEQLPSLEGQRVRPEQAVLDDGFTQLTSHQCMKILYYLKRDSVSYGKIDAVKHDINVEDISCDGYNMRVWVYHGDHEQIITNVKHDKRSLDDFVVNLAQKSGQGISKREPQVDVTLPDGSRGQLTLGQEVSDHGTNYTIRQFKDVPFTPLDLINWHTFSPEQMAFLWLCIENNKSLVFAGGTASGKTTSLNAVSLFIPSNTKIVSIEDTREVELPQRNWVASVTRPSFGEDGGGEVNEFDLLEAALRQRPDYIVMGEIRGEEGRTLFQVMSTGHTTYTTFHADSVGEVIKRFTTDPINVSKTLFTSLDLVSIQTSTRVEGKRVRRNKALTEINSYNSDTDDINVNDVFKWYADDDAFTRVGTSSVLESIQFDRGWDTDQLERELEKREVVLAYLLLNRLNTYTEVAATIQAFINEPDVVLDLIANDVLKESLDNLRQMESVAIEIDEEKEEMVPRPDAPDDIIEWATKTIETAKSTVLEGRRGANINKTLREILPDETVTEITKTGITHTPEPSQEPVTEPRTLTSLDPANNEGTMDELNTELSSEEETQDNHESSHQFNFDSFIEDSE